ncbi:MAG: PDZ domain-containing protein [Bryobacteraceae bacterium]|nr:PDZ domain-containing protein [Bryobacteraceae bacterium]
MTSIRYTVSFPDRATHYVNVLAEVPTEKRPNVELMMAVWTPGSYLVREYARHVEGFAVRASNGRALQWEKSTKNRWKVTTDGESRLFVQYRVYSREMSVRTNWVERDFALLNGAPTFITLADEKSKRPHEVKLLLPNDWKGSHTGLSAKAPNEYIAPDYDTLVDSPILAGSPVVHEFEVGGKKHYLVNQGEGQVWDGPASAQAAQKIVGEYFSMMGPLPYDKYVFLNLLVEAGGGLEHANSTTLMGSRWAWRNAAEPPEPGSTAPRRASRISWLDLVSHEYFHLWNVKRMRPAELGPFDYETENYTRGLWVAEGFTTYYGPLTVKRAGLMNQSSFLRLLSADIYSLQRTPGRLAQPLEQSSLDAWIKHYRPDENSANTSISYYTKGAVVAWLLDAKIRKGTNGEKSLDDLMRVAYAKFAGERGFTGPEFRALASEVARQDLSNWFRQVLETTEELDYREALDWFGLRFKLTSDSTKAYLGVTTKVDNGRLVIATVPRDTPAHAAGLNVDDEIIAIDGIRVRSDGLPARLEAYKPADTVQFSIARRDQLTTLPVTLTSEPSRNWTLEPLPGATPDQRSRLAAWLKD